MDIRAKEAKRALEVLLSIALQGSTFSDWGVRKEGKMRYIRVFLIGVLAAGISACAVVYSTKPVGQNPVMIDAKDWKGTWILPGGSMTIRVADAKKGLLQAAFVEESDDKLKMEVHDVTLLESGNWIFWSMKDKPEAEGVRYFWGRIKNEKNQMYVWQPDAEKFKELVKAGKLPGTVEKDNVVLGELTPDHLKLITSEEAGVLFDWASPAVFTKLAD